jgi:uroporphyrinogen III methyltransferase/synthase
VTSTRATARQSAAKSAGKTVSTSATGSVAFVGAGPGDPGLLTIRAVSLLAGADIVVFDVVARDAFLEHCRDDVEVVDGAVGDDGSELTVAARGRLLTRLAKSGKRVVRLMDGDAAGTAGMAEEAQACAKAGIEFEVVPGVAGATAIPAYAGMPVNAAIARGFHVVSVMEPNPDWSLHAEAEHTVIVPGTHERVLAAATALIAVGRPGETAVAVTSRGTTTAQRTVVSTLEALPRDLKGVKLDEPLLMVVGGVVGLRDTLSWFETKSLFGWRVLVPRTKEQAGALSARLRSHGAVPEEVPTISVEAPRTPQQMDRAIQGLVSGRYLWVAFTSVNAVRAVREKFEEYGLDARAFAGVKVASVGEQTAAALVSFGVRPDLVPSTEQSSVGLLEDWPEYDSTFDPLNRVFLPRADIATETLSAGLVELGWEVDDVTAYRTVRAAPPAIEIREAIKSGGFDAVVFTSSSTVRNLVGIAGKPHTSTVIAAIGPQTAKTAEEHGLRVDVLAAEPSMEAVVEALAEYGAAQRQEALEHGESVWRPSLKRGAPRRKAK